MIKLYFNNIPKKEFIFVLFPILIAPIVMGVTSTYLDSIMYGHYITLVPNVIFLIFCYKQYSKINSMYTIITTRIGCFKTFLISILFSISTSIIYSLILYLYLALFLKLPGGTDVKVAYLYII